MELKSYQSYFLDKEKTMELSHILLEEEEDWYRSCYLSILQRKTMVELNSLCSFFFWREEDGAVFLLSFWRMRKMELKAYWSFFLGKEKTAVILQEEEEDPCRSCYWSFFFWTKRKVEINSLCSFLFWREEDGAKCLLVLLPLEREDYGAQSYSFGRGGRLVLFYWRKSNTELNFWRKRKMKLKSYWSYFLQKQKAMELQSFFWKKTGTEAATGPSPRGKGGTKFPLFLLLLEGGRWSLSPTSPSSRNRRLWSCSHILQEEEEDCCRSCYWSFFF